MLDNTGFILYLIYKCNAKFEFLADFSRTISILSLPIDNIAYKIAYTISYDQKSNWFYEDNLL